MRALRSQGGAGADSLRNESPARGERTAPAPHARGARGRLAPAGRGAYNARMTHDADARRKAVSAGRPHGPAASIIARG